MHPTSPLPVGKSDDHDVGDAGMARERGLVGMAGMAHYYGKYGFDMFDAREVDARFSTRCLDRAPVPAVLAREKCRPRAVVRALRLAPQELTRKARVANAAGGIAKEVGAPTDPSIGLSGSVPAQQKTPRQRRVRLEDARACPSVPTSQRDRVGHPSRRRAPSRTMSPPVWLGTSDDADVPGRSGEAPSPGCPRLDAQ